MIPVPLDGGEDQRFYAVGDREILFSSADYRRVCPNG